MVAESRQDDLKGPFLEPFFDAGKRYPPHHDPVIPAMKHSRIARRRKFIYRLIIY